MISLRGVAKKRRRQEPAAARGKSSGTVASSQHLWTPGNGPHHRQEQSQNEARNREQSAIGRRKRRMSGCVEYVVAEPTSAPPIPLRMDTGASCSRTPEPKSSRDRESRRRSSGQIIAFDSEVRRASENCANLGTGHSRARTLCTQRNSVSCGGGDRAAPGARVIRL